MVPRKYIKMSLYTTLLYLAGYIIISLKSYHNKVLPSKQSHSVMTADIGSALKSNEHFIERESSFVLMEDDRNMNKSINDKQLLVLLYRIRGYPHSGPNLSSVIDVTTGRSCRFTFDQQMFSQSDVVIFPGRVLKQKIVDQRPPGQKWVYSNHESLFNVKFNKKYQYVFNHTMTYHTHSDIAYSIGGCIRPSEYYWFRNKTKLVAWMASHCPTQTRREELVKELSKHIKVDMYGDCGSISCSKGELCEDTFRQYKFYLAFENSMCNDYVTEKAWLGLLFYMVPLVLGAGSDSYKRVLPPNSYIDVTEFKTVKELAAYLKQLDEDSTLYEAYHAWRSLYKCGVFSRYDVSARTCQYLHKTSGTGPHMVDLGRFYMDPNAVCHPTVVNKTILIK